MVCSSYVPPMFSRAIADQELWDPAGLAALHQPPVFGAYRLQVEGPLILRQRVQQLLGLQSQGFGSEFHVSLADLGRSVLPWILLADSRRSG